MEPCLELGPLETETLSNRSGNWDLVHIEVRCNNFSAAIKKVSELLFVVVQYASLHRPDDSEYDENRDFEIDLEFWLAKLPT